MRGFMKWVYGMDGPSDAKNPINKLNKFHFPN